jgi:hypothetical protein
MDSRRLYLCVLVCLGAFLYAQSETAFEWMRPDRFDEINDKFYGVTGENCRSKREEDLMLRDDTIAQKTRYNKLLSTVIYSNR